MAQERLNYIKGKVEEILNHAMYSKDVRWRALKIEIALAKNKPYAEIEKMYQQMQIQISSEIVAQRLDKIV